MRRRRPHAEALAAAFLAADTWEVDALVRHGSVALGLSARTAWLRRLAKRTLLLFDERPSSRFRELARAIDDALGESEEAPDLGRPIATFPVPTLSMGRGRWPVPPLATAGDLAAWLDLSPARLLWFADPRGLERRRGAGEALRHYRYQWVPKPSGAFRLLEAPKPRMKAIGRRILQSLLDRVPPHEAAHGFRRGCSTLTHAAQHVGASVVLRIDLADFFLSIRAARVRAIFAALGYPSEVAWLLTCLTTNIAPVTPNVFPASTSVDALRATRHAEMLARTRHLPQGAPTSPALANLVAYGLDVRLTAAASSVLVRYSRYADDLVFSGGPAFARQAIRFVRLVESIALDEGFAVNRRKTRIMRRGARQSVTGLVVNERPTVGRAEVERLEAILFNCVRHGPASQNRANVSDFRAHLTGRVAHVASIDLRRSGRLRELLSQIVWG